MLRNEMGVTINVSTLWDFYQRNKIKNYKCSTTYAQAQLNEGLPAARMRFALELANLIKLNLPVVYFDESSCNSWHRRSHTWSTAARPVKLVVNKRREAITIFGAIGTCMPKPVFM